jgi:hypothetical protein
MGIHPVRMRLPVHSGPASQKKIPNPLNRPSQRGYSSVRPAMTPSPTVLCPHSCRALPQPRRTPWSVAPRPIPRERATAAEHFRKRALENRRRAAPLLHRRAPCAGIELRNDERPLVQATRRDCAKSACCKSMF